MRRGCPFLIRASLLPEYVKGFPMGKSHEINHFPFAFIALDS